MDTSPPAVASAKDFLSVLDLGPVDLERLLAIAAQLKAERRLGPKAPTASALAGMHVALLFEKPSLRTRSTFEIAIRELGGCALDVPAEFADGTREPMEDVARNLERWVHALVIRTFAQRKVETVARAALQMRVINALTDEQHPCQALADMLTALERWGGRLEGRTIAYVGDGNNTATSLAHACCLMGIRLRLASPPGFALPDHVVAQAMAVAARGAEIVRVTEPRDAVAGADAVYTDVWTSMGAESEESQRRPAFLPYQVNDALMAQAAPDALFMHCLPAHRGEEVTADVMESAASVVFDQAENRLHTEKALLLMLLGR